ncbi:dTDP-4-amino-4,6-dideoxygalactose transaminase [Reichenbachiella faecimaris]|uniref:dTDP-4-amino-4,6-dideoxygalactose transaminase n=2 Tax=Reichenbachiella faecimaris TaxID=692418 RepID=A0A1W2G7N5_REIFA|nr:dTDP-4-amino-4,6-dideoxygalactose transaminase [Reichenbachiella faecimaris]
MHVPFVELKSQYQLIKSEIDEAMANVIAEGHYVGGAVVSRFESDFAKYVGVNYCISCGNGTDALEIALQALEIGSGDEVIVPAMSWISTAEVVSTVGAKPIFADILPDCYTIDPTDIVQKITAKTKAIIPVHFYGRPAQMDEITDVAKNHNLKIVEDCAQAHGAKYNGKSVGTFGDLGTFSFYPSKNLGAFGDAGGIVTNDDSLAKSCRLIGNHGQEQKHHHLREGRNSRMDALQAAVLQVKLKYLEEWTAARTSKAKYYNEQLAGLPVELPVLAEHHRHVFHVYAIQVNDRDQLKRKLAERGVDTQIHNPLSLPELLPYQQFDANDFPVAKAMAAKTLSLPIYPEITQKQQDHVVAMLKELL